VGYGVHELNEAGILPNIINEVWNINHILDDKSEVGLFFKALFGYNGNPSLSETITYSLYGIFVGYHSFKPAISRPALKKP